MKRITLKPILLVCLGLVIATTVFAASYPSRPFNLRVLDIFSDGCELGYDAPRSDGGSPVEGYLIEYKYNMFTRWEKINRMPGNVLVCRVYGMQEGRSARFRVFAINEFGISEPSEPSESVKFKD